jgi:ribosomal protein S18 acetylase RimI-like enzyme
MFEIKKLSDLDDDEKIKALESIEEIFFISSSKKDFESTEKKNLFFKRWCGDYQTFYPKEFFLAYEEDKLLGYLSGCSDSLRAQDELNVPGYSIFQDLFNNFPAHLHINFHPDARGKGLGSLLVNHYIKVLRKNGVKGVHLVTSPEAKNVSFYDRLGFTHTYTREFKGSPLYFMGNILD